MAGAPSHRGSAPQRRGAPGRKPAPQRQGARAEQGASRAPQQHDVVQKKAVRMPRKNGKIQSDLNEVVAAVESLYADRLKPYGRILRKRIAEHALGIVDNSGDIPTQLPVVDEDRLKAVCSKASDLFQIKNEEGGDWSVVLKDRSEPFVDAHSREDPYPEEMWVAAGEYFAGLPEGEAKLPGGRYSCAQALVRRNTAFLSSYTLGQVCHIVELGISQRKILGYSSGSVVPYALSQSMVKEKCANCQQQCVGADGDGAAGGGGLPAASLETARRCLRELLASEAPVDAAADSVGRGAIPLSNVKRLFRSKLQLELSETSLGHSKLSELLMNKDLFGDICEVQLQGQGYIVMQAQAAGSAQVEAQDADAARPQPATQRVVFCEDEPLDLAVLEEDDEPTSVQPASVQRACSEPVDLKLAELLGCVTPRAAPGARARATASLLSPSFAPTPKVLHPATPLMSPGERPVVDRPWGVELIFDAGDFPPGLPLVEPTPTLSPGVPSIAMLSRWGIASAGGC